MCSSNFSSRSCMKYCFDLDGTICDTPLRQEDLKPGYLESIPYPIYGRAS